MYCLYFIYICPCAESNGYFYGSHSTGSDEVAHVSLLVRICTVYILPSSVLVLSLMGFFYGTHSKGSDEEAHVSLLI